MSSQICRADAYAQNLYLPIEYDTTAFYIGQIPAGSIHFAATAPPGPSIGCGFFSGSSCILTVKILFAFQACKMIMAGGILIKDCNYSNATNHIKSPLVMSFYNSKFSKGQLRWQFQPNSISFSTFFSFSEKALQMGRFEFLYFSKSFQTTCLVFIICRYVLN